MKYLTSFDSFNLITEAVEGTSLANPTPQPTGAKVLSCQFNGQPVTDTKSILTIPGSERMPGPSLIIWTIQNKDTVPTIIQTVDGANLEYKGASIDFTRSPIGPGKTGTVTLKVSHLSTMDCSAKVGSYNDTTLAVTTSAGRVEVRARFSREAAPTRVETCRATRLESEHNLLAALEIGTGLLGMVFPVLLFASAGISALDAKLYWDQGDKKMAGLTALFMLLPASAKAASLIGPSLKKLGPKGMSLLAGKLAKGTALTVIEKEVVKAIAKNPTLLQQVANGAKAVAGKAVQAVKPIAKDIATYAAVGKAYGAGYDSVAGTGKFGLAEFIKTQGYTQNDVKGIISAFGSDDTKEQNSMIVSAMKEGWKLGDVVPEKWRTSSYTAQLKQDTDAVAALDKKLAELGI